MKMSWYCDVCGKVIKFGEEEAYELLYWPENDDCAQIKGWHGSCYRSTKSCDDCAKFRRPTCVSDPTLGFCEEGMFGDLMASEMNESACRHFKDKALIR
jgi:hypothetical protein